MGFYGQVRITLVFLHWGFLCLQNKFGSLNVFTIILPTTNKTLIYAPNYRQ